MNIAQIRPLAIVNEGMSYLAKYTDKARYVTIVSCRNEPFTMDGRPYRHGHMSIDLRRAVEVPLLDYAVACGTNQPGWGDAAIGTRKAAAFRELAARGHSFVYESDSWHCGTISLRWQEYDPNTYCGAPRIDFTQMTPDAIMDGMDAVRMLARATDKAAGHESQSGRLDWSLSNPTKVWAALVSSRIGAVHVARGYGTGEQFGEDVNAVHSRLAFLTDGAE